MKALKIVTSLTLVFSIVNFNCKPDEPKNSWAYINNTEPYTIFTEELFGINFCKIGFINIVKEFQRNKIEFEYFKPHADTLVKYEGEKINLKDIDFIKTSHFIGTELDINKIIQVNYAGSYYEEGWIQLTIKFKEDYFNTLLTLLGNKLGTKSVHYNRNKYNETSWNADPSHAVPTCISHIAISKKLRWDDDKKGEKGVCYLEIETRPSNPHVH